MKIAYLIRFGTCVLIEARMVIILHNLTIHNYFTIMLQLEHVEDEIVEVQYINSF